MDNNIITTGYIGTIVLSLFIYILLIAIYTYILKLERSGCECAKHPSRDFIKVFSIISLIFLPLLTLIPPNYIIINFGITIATVIAFVKFLFYITFIIFLFYTLEYTRYLINEKCKCSEDMRREFIMVGVIIEIVIILLILLVVILLPMVFCSINVIFENVGTFENKVASTLKNPYDSIKDVPKNLSKASRLVQSIGKTSLDTIKKISKPTSSRRSRSSSRD